MPAAVPMFERWKWNMENIDALDWDEFWDLAEAVKLLYEREKEAAKRG